MDTDSGARGHRAIGLSLFGLVILVAGASLLWIGTRKPDAEQIVGTYEYTVTQDAKAAVHYVDNDFYGNSPAASNSAYVAALTDAITANFQYKYSAVRTATLTSTYDIKAQIKANYAVKGNTEDLSNVWTRDYQLIEPVTATSDGALISISRTVTVPFADYMHTVEQFRTSLALPTNSEVVVTFTAHVNGTVDGTPFSDVRTSTISVPLDEQIYIPSVKFDKTDTKQVTPVVAAQTQDRWAKTGIISGAALAVAGLSLLIYGMRKRIFKTTYQRELDKIYRYHNGIIVRTSRPVDLTDHQVVPMRSFDDMLNLEEELKSPIIADEISSTMTHFMIANNNVMYLFKLGTDDGTNERLAIHIAHQTAQPKAAREVLPPAQHPELDRVHTYGVKQAAPTQSEAAKQLTITPAAVAKPTSIDSIIRDIGKKPTPKHKK